MANMTIKNIPDELYECIKRSAKANRRSINNEVIVCLQKFLQGSTPLDPVEFLERADRMRARMPHIYLTEENLRAAKDEGRP